MAIATSGPTRQATPSERVPGDFKRRPDGTPYVTSPDGATTKNGTPRWQLYGRASSLGKQIEDGYSLAKWGERMVAAGIAHAVTTGHDLATEIRALADGDNNDQTWRALADDIARRAKQLAGADQAADRGTHTHETTELADTERDPIAAIERGETLGIPAAAQTAMLQAWQTMLDAYDLEVLEVEARVVHDGLGVAGTLDRVVRTRRDLRLVTHDGEIVTITAGTVILLDLKTGKLRLNREGTHPLWWHSYAVQCWVYADSVPYHCDGEHIDTRGEWPWKISREWALIAHLPVDEALAGAATCQLIPVALPVAAEAAEACRWARSWEKRGDVFARMHPDEPTITVEVGPLEPPELEPPELEPPVDDLAERRTKLVERLRAMSPDVQRVLVAAWPPDIPSLRGDHEHTAAELDRVDALIAEHVQDRAGTQTRIPPTPTPTPAAPQPAPETGPMADQERVEALRNVISRLPAEQTSWAAQWAKEAFDAGTPIVVSPSLPETWTERRCDLSTAAIRLSHIAAQDDDEARARATVAIIIDDAARVTTPIGAAIGQCDNTQAAKLLAAAERVLDGADLWGLAFDLDPTGVETVRWTDPAF